MFLCISVIFFTFGADFIYGDMDYKDIATKVCALCREVGSFIRRESEVFAADCVEYKGLHDMVSYVDKGAEKRIIDGLSAILPAASFLAEESGGSMTRDGITWIIDPLDGTTNFVHHLPFYSISIALMEDDDLVLGVVYEVVRGECFYSYRGGAVFVDDRQVRISEETRLDRALLATGFPYRDFSKLRCYSETLYELMMEAQGIRRCGSAALDLAYVAAGRYEAFFEYALHPWDVAAGIFLVRQAGGQATTWDGNGDCISGNEIVAGNDKVCATIMEIIRKHRS